MSSKGIKLARIHDLDILDTTKMRFSDVRKTLQRSDGSKKISNIVRAPTINFIENDEATLKQLMEATGNKSFSPMHIQDDYSINYYGDPVNLRHTLAGKDGNVRKFSITVQNHYWKLMMDWTSVEITTDWDLIFSPDFTAHGTDEDTDEGTGDVVDTVNWWAVSGDWVFVSANDWYYCNVDSGWNHLLAYGSDTADYPAIGDVTVQVTLQNGSAQATHHGIALRMAIDNSAFGSGYTFTHQLTSDKYYFRRHDGATATIIKEWDAGYDLPTSTDIRLKVVCRGNRFDCYADYEIATDEFELRYVGTVIDDEYETGWFGFSTENINNALCRDFSLLHAKPLVLRFPVGSYDVYKVRMPYTTRLSDDINADGLSRMVIAPEDPVIFRQNLPVLKDSTTTMLIYPSETRLGTLMKDHSGLDFRAVTFSSGIEFEDVDTGTIVDKPVVCRQRGGSDHIIYESDGWDDEQYNTFTIECLFRHHSGNVQATTPTRYTAFAGWNSWSPGTQKGIQLSVYSTNPAWQIEIADGVNYASYDLAPWAPTVDTWHFVTIVGDLANDSLKFYVDGELNKTFSSTVNHMIMEDDHQFYFFRSGINDTYTKGSLGLFHMMRRTLDATEVRDRYLHLAFNDPAGKMLKMDSEEVIVSR